MRLHWRDWGDDSVVIELLSGQTLSFDPFSAAVMACIEDGARDATVVAAALASDLARAPDDAELNASLWTVLERLYRLGWIEPTPAASG